MSDLQREIRQTKPFRSAKQEAALAVMKTADAIRRKAAAMLEPYGLTTQQYNVLRILRGAGGPMPTLDIAERMIEQTPGITRLLDRLEEKALVRRDRCSEDRRRVLCTLSDEGHALLERIGHDLEDADEDMLSPLEPEEVAALLDTLAKIRRHA